MAAVAYSYLRFSKRDQGLGDSQRRQLEGSAARAQELGCVMADDGFYSDRGVSGFRGKNSAVGELRRFLDRVEDGTVRPGSVLIVESLDRLGRDEIGDALGRFLDILRAGVQIATVEPKRLYSKKSISDTGSLLEVILIMQRGAEESMTKSHRCGKAWENKRRQAAEERKPPSRQTPGWIELTDKGYVLMPERARAVRAIIKWAAEGEGAGRIAHLLRADPKLYPPWGPSGDWSPTHVWQIIRHPAVWGAYQGKRVVPGKSRQPAGDPIPGHYPPAVNLKDAEAALAGLKARKWNRGGRGPGKCNVLARLVHNAATGQPMCLISYVRDGQTWVSLRDSRHRTGAPQGTANRIPYALVESAILDTIEGMSVAELVGTDQGDGDQQREARELEATLDGLNGKLEALGEAIADPANPPSIVARLTATMRDLDQQGMAARERLAVLRTELECPPGQLLTECQQSIRELAQTDGPDRERVRARIKAGLKRLLSGVWIYTQRWHKRSKAIHLQMWYATGTMTPLTVLVGKPPTGAELVNLEGVDLRQGYPPPARKGRGTA